MEKLRQNKTLGGTESGKTTALVGHPKVILYTKFEHFGIIWFRVMLRTNRQTDRQTDGLEHPTHVDQLRSALVRIKKPITNNSSSLSSDYQHHHCCN